MTGPFSPDSAPVRPDRDGFCVIRDLLPTHQIDAIDSSLAYDFAATPYCIGEFFGQRTQRFGRLITRATQTSALGMHDAVLSPAQSILQPTRDRIALNLPPPIRSHHHPDG